MEAMSFILRINSGLVAVTGAASDLTLRGIWKSTTGNLNSYTQLAGGSNLGVDSVDGWRGNAYTYQLSGTEKFYDPRRTLLALAPSDENILYVLYENGLSNTSSGRNKEADLFKLNMTSGNVWTNLSGNLPDFPGGDHDATDPFTIQGGYDLFIAVKPTDGQYTILTPRQPLTAAPLALSLMAGSVISTSIAQPALVVTNSLAYPSAYGLSVIARGGYGVYAEGGTYGVYARSYNAYALGGHSDIGTAIYGNSGSDNGVSPS
jgi:hypothetical protein